MYWIPNGKIELTEKEVIVFVNQNICWDCNNNFTYNSDNELSHSSDGSGVNHGDYEFHLANQNNRGNYIDNERKLPIIKRVVNTIMEKIKNHNTNIENKRKKDKEDEKYLDNG